MSHHLFYYSVLKYKAAFITALYLKYGYVIYSSVETKTFLNNVRSLFYNELIKSSPFTNNASL